MRTALTVNHHCWIAVTIEHSAINAAFESVCNSRKFTSLTHDHAVEKNKFPHWSFTCVDCSQFCKTLDYFEKMHWWVFQLYFLCTTSTSESLGFVSSFIPVIFNIHLLCKSWVSFPLNHWINTSIWPCIHKHKNMIFFN